MKKWDWSNTTAVPKSYQILFDEIKYMNSSNKYGILITTNTEISLSTFSKETKLSSMLNKPFFFSAIPEIQQLREGLRVVSAPNRKLSTIYSHKTLAETRNNE